jgi:hypothetical protein
VCVWWETTKQKKKGRRTAKTQLVKACHGQSTPVKLQVFKEDSEKKRRSAGSSQKAAPPLADLEKKKKNDENAKIFLQANSQVGDFNRDESSVVSLLVVAFLESVTREGFGLDEELQVSVACLDLDLLNLISLLSEELNVAQQNHFFTNSKLQNGSLH